MRQAFTITASLLLLCALFAAGAWVYLKTSMHGFSARAQPSRMETIVAEYARETAMPASAGNMKNPVALTPEIQHQAMAHFADRCAVCHANNGSGNTMFGKSMYPKPPDLRSDETQGMSDGETYYDIENGIRMSGMPAFGGKDTADDSWKLVLFIHHLPHLTPAEEAEMQSLNPKGPAEVQEVKKEQRLLNGGGLYPTSVPHTLKGHSL